MYIDFDFRKYRKYIDVIITIEYSNKFHLGFLDKEEAKSLLNELEEAVDTLKYMLEED